MELTKPGEGVHLIEKRVFPGDVRRHFVGEIEACAEGALRVKGYLFVYDSSTSQFTRKPELRTRVVPLDNRVIFNILPEAVPIEQIRYAHDAEGNLSIRDGRDFELDISEFSTRE